MAARISEISFIKNVESEIFIKNPNLTKKKKKKYGGWEGRGWGVARVSDFFNESKSEKKQNIFLEGVKVRDDWLV